MAAFVQWEEPWLGGLSATQFPRDLGMVPSSLQAYPSPPHPNPSCPCLLGVVWTCSQTPLSPRVPMLGS